MSQIMMLILFVLLVTISTAFPLKRPALPFSDKDDAFNSADAICEAFQQYFINRDIPNAFETYWGHDGDIFNDNSNIYLYKDDGTKTELDSETYAGYDDIKNVFAAIDIQPEDASCLDIVNRLTYSDYTLEWNAHHFASGANENNYQWVDVTYTFTFHSFDHTLQEIDVWSQFNNDLWDDLQHD